MPAKTQIHLPSCLTKSDVYALAIDDLSQGGLECCKKSTFYQVWHNEFPKVYTCNSCLMVFTVYGICTAQGLYVLPRAARGSIIQHKGARHCKNHETAILY